MSSEIKLKALRNRIKVVPIVQKGITKALGLPLIGKPNVKKVDESFNIDLPTVDGRMLSRYMQWATGWLAYSIALGAKFDNEYNAIDTALTRTVALYRTSGAFKGPKYRVDAAINAEESVAKLRDDLEVIQAKRNIVAAHISVYESRVALISRELSRRGMEVQR